MTESEYNIDVTNKLKIVMNGLSKVPWDKVSLIKIKWDRLQVGEINGCATYYKYVAIPDISIKMK